MSQSFSEVIEVGGGAPRGRGLGGAVVPLVKTRTEDLREMRWPAAGWRRNNKCNPVTSDKKKENKKQSWI